MPKMIPEGIRNHVEWLEQAQAPILAFLSQATDAGDVASIKAGAEILRLINLLFRRMSAAQVAELTAEEGKD